MVLFRTENLGLSMCWICCLRMTIQNQSYHTGFWKLWKLFHQQESLHCTNITSACSSCSSCSSWKSCCYLAAVVLQSSCVCVCVGGAWSAFEACRSRLWHIKSFNLFAWKLRLKPNLFSGFIKKRTGKDPDKWRWSRAEVRGLGEFITKHISDLDSSM